MRFVHCLFLVFVAAAGSSFLIAHAHDQPIAAIDSELAARKTAETAFLEATDHAIKKYNIHSLKHTAALWRFSVVGADEFERPGYDWLVYVDKVSGKTEVLTGE